MRHEAEVRRRLAEVLGDEGLAEELTQAAFAALSGDESPDAPAAEQPSGAPASAGPHGEWSTGRTGGEHASGALHATAASS